MRSPAQFAAIVALRGACSLRLEGDKLAMKAAWPSVATLASEPRVRLGVTVAKRLARRSVDRSAIKRLLRESFRHGAGRIEPSAARLGADVGISFRWKAPVESMSGGQLRRWKREIRAEADRLLETLVRELDRAR